MTTFKYATLLEVAQASAELASAYRSGTLLANQPLTVNQVYGLSGYGLAMGFGDPTANPTPPVVPIGGPRGDFKAVISFDEACERCQTVVRLGGVVPAEGGADWLKLAVNTILKTVLASFPEFWSTLTLPQLIDHVF